MGDPDLREREDAFRTDVARLVQAMRHYLAARSVPDEIAPLIDPVQHMALLLDADAPAEHLREAALTALQIYRWPASEASAADESAELGPGLDPAVVAAIERLRSAIDVLDAGSGAGSRPGRGALGGQPGSAPS